MMAIVVVVTHWVVVAQQQLAKMYCPLYKSGQPTWDCVQMIDIVLFLCMCVSVTNNSAMYDIMKKT